MPLIADTGSDLYVEPFDVREVLAPDAADDESTAAEMSDDALRQAIIDAQAEVNGHLLDRYEVPFAQGQVPQLVKGITRDLAAYLATLTHRRAGNIDESEVVWLRYSRASALLERLGSGAMDLATAEAVMEATAGEPTVVNPRDYDLFSDTDELGLVDTWLP